MSTTHEQNSYDPGQSLPAEQPPTEKGNVLFYCLGGCLVMLVIGVIAIGILSYVVYYKGKAMATNVARTTMKQAIEDSELSEADKREINTQIDRVADDFEAGKITFEQVTQIGQELSESPLLVIGMVYFVEQNYIKDSSLTDDEKAQAHLTLQRAARGVYEEKITQEQINQAAAPLMKTGPNGEQQLKEQVSDEELREFLADTKQLADDAEIPDEEYEVEIGQEFRKAVDRVYEKNAR